MNRFYCIIYTLAKPFIRLLFPYRAEGLANLPQGGAVICANHVSAVDPVVLAIAMPRTANLRFMAKAELFRNPLVGWFLRKCGAFPVHRGEGDIHAIKMAMKCLQSGQKLMLFPEGTRVDYQGETDAKGGAVMLSLRLGVPMVPVYCGEKKKFLHMNRIVFGEPYLPQFAGRRPTAEESHAFAQELLQRIYALKEEKR